LGRSPAPDAAITGIPYSKISGLGIGTMLAAFTMGKVIGKISDWIGKHMCFTSFLERSPK
jgi:hypothetical protein